MKKVLFVVLILSFMLSFVVAISSVGEANNCLPQLNGSVWSGVEAQQGNELNGWIGGEVYFSEFFLQSKFAPEARLDLNCYDTIDLSATIGLRVIYPHYSIGIGVGTNLYNGEYDEKYDKWYNWISAYYPHFFSKVYFEITRNSNYGQFSSMVDLTTQPLGASVSYFYSLNPGGEYEELRGDLSVSLLYPYQFYDEKDNHFDFRLFVGGRIAYFFSPATLYRGDWQGCLGGLRLVVPKGDLRLEFQVANKSDQYVCGIEGKVVISGSWSF